MIWEEHDRLDERCVQMMLDTSDPWARWNYHRAIERGDPAYDTCSLDPRAYTVPCSGPGCTNRAIVLPTSGWKSPNHYCCGACLQRAYYHRQPLEVRIRKAAAYRRANPEKIDQYHHAYYDRHRDEINARKRRARRAGRA